MTTENWYAEDAYPERAALSAMLKNAPDTIEDALDILGEDGQCFEEEPHGVLYSAFMELYRNGHPIDVVTAYEKLQSQGMSKMFGTLASYLSELYDLTPTSHNFRYYAQAVRRRYIRREILKTLNKTGGALQQARMTEEEAMSNIEAQMFSLSMRRKSNRPASVSDVLPEVLGKIRGYRAAGAPETGAMTGLSTLDGMMQGLKPGTLNVLAARPSVGKTAVAINIAIAAARSGYPVLFFSLEMPRTAIVERMVTLISRTSVKDLTGEFLPRVQEQKLKVAELDLHEIPMDIVDAGELELTRLRARCRRYAGAVYPQTPLVIIDYLQLSCRSSVSDKQRNELIGDFTRECKQLAGELHCPFLLLSQLNRAADEADNPFRVMHCLKDSGNIEEDSDTVTILLKDMPEFAKKQAAERGVMPENTVIGGLVKNKYGPTGMFPLYFEKDTQFVQDLRDYDGMVERPREPVQCEIPDEEDVI